MNARYNRNSGKLEVTSTSGEYTKFQFNEDSGEIEIYSDEIEIYSETPSKRTPLRKIINFIKDWKELLIPAAGYIIKKSQTILPVIPKGIIEYVLPITIFISAVIILQKLNAITRKLDHTLEKIEALERGIPNPPVDADTPKG